MFTAMLFFLSFGFDSGYLPLANCNMDGTPEGCLPKHRTAAVCRHVNDVIIRRLARTSPATS